MKNYSIYIILIIIWCLLQVISYYSGILFLFVFILIFFLLTILFFRHLRTKSLKERIFKLLIVIVLLTSTSYLQRLIEKVDWHIHYDTRVEIVNKVKSGELKPNVSWNNIICELPKEYPLVSNDGNDIVIYKDKEFYTIEFFISRGFLDTPSLVFVYTDSPNEMKELEMKIKEAPSINWKLAPNWYRVLRE